MRGASSGNQKGLSPNSINKLHQNLHSQQSYGRKSPLVAKGMIKMSKLPANMNTSAITNSVNQLTKQSNNQISALNKSNTIDNASVGSNPSASLNRNKNKSL